MPGISGCIAATGVPAPAQEFLGAIDLLNSGHSGSFTGSSVQIAACSPNQLFTDSRFRQSDRHVISVSGHIVSKRDLDWPDIADSVAGGRLACLDELSGRFAGCIYDRRRRMLHLITDRISQHPLYLLGRGDDWYWSTSQASFARLEEPPGFNERWLHEFILCNFSPTHQSFLQGVERLPAATVTTLDVETGKRTTRPYAGQLRDNRSGLPVHEAIESAKAVLAERLPLYLRDDERALSGLTSGFDSRLILAYFMGRDDYATYTYGIPGCADLEAATSLAEVLGVQHTVIGLDDKFETSLPELITRTVWLSAGLQTCIRSSLCYAYASISAQLPGRAVLLTGSSGDQFFRSSGNIPSIVSPVIDVLFRTGKFPNDLPRLAGSIFNTSQQCVENIEAVRKHIVARYGDPTRTPAHLGYLTYEVPAEYFAGEAALAEIFFDYRTPFCDQEILNLAWSFNLSTLGRSKFGADGPPPNRRMNYLHACLIGTNPIVARQPIQGRPLWAFTANNAPLYYAVSALCRLKSSLQRVPRQPPLEDWPRWFAGLTKEPLQKLLGADARIREFVHGAYIEDSMEVLDPARLNKLVTAEILMRLAGNGWNLNTID